MQKREPLIMNKVVYVKLMHLDYFLVLWVVKRQSILAHSTVMVQPVLSLFRKIWQNPAPCFYHPFIPFSSPILSGWHGVFLEERIREHKTVLLVWWSRPGMGSQWITWNAINIVSSNAVLGFCLRKMEKKRGLDEGTESSLALLLDLHVPSKRMHVFLCG